jgi:hypothetical protein
VGAAAVAAWGAAPGRARARETDPYRRDQVLVLIAETAPEPTLADWKRVGPEANRILVDLAQEPELRPSLRLRAMAYLAWFPSRRTQAFLTRRLYARQAPAIERRVAMRALALAFGREVFPDLRGFLTDPDPGVREGAIRALALLGGARVRTLLENHLAAEESLGLKRVTEEVLAELSRPRAGRPPAIEPDEPRGGPGSVRRPPPR